MGEQPGDQEDFADRPFVGPAGNPFWIGRWAKPASTAGPVYVTNAVKHFKFVLRGCPPAHQKPDSSEIDACRTWLARELEIIQPRIVVALGATAAHSLLGKPVTISRERGCFRPWRTSHMLVTVHPSFILRVPDADAKDQEYARLVSDLQVVSEAMRGQLPEPAQAALL